MARDGYDSGSLAEVPSESEEVVVANDIEAFRIGRGTIDGSGNLAEVPNELRNSPPGDALTFTRKLNEGKRVWIGAAHPGYDLRFR